MARLNKKTVTSKVKRAASVVTASTVPNARTALGGIGFTRDTKSELYLLAVSNFVGVDLFHEKAPARDDRFEKLVHAVAVADPEWMLDFVTWLRGSGNMRTASLIAGAEACRALLAEGNTDGWTRKLISAPLRRADEPGEMLGYWAGYSTVKAGKALKLPKPVKRGIADAVVRLYSEYGALKYDTASKGVRFGDILELTHPAARPDQSALFKFLIDSRHGRGIATDALPMIQAQAALRASAARGNYDGLLDPDRLLAAGMTWEDSLSLAGSKVPKAKLWEALVPTMGIFALVRNLRNFTDAGVSSEARNEVARKLDDPAVIAKSRMFPFRFLSAYRANANNLQWAYPLERALSHSLANVPSLPGRTLVLVDRSGSMFASVTGAKGDDPLTMADQAAVFGVAVAVRAENADLIEFGSTSGPIPFKKTDSVLATLKKFSNLGGTETRAALQRYYKGHDRVIIITDEQHSVWAGGYNMYGGGRTVSDWVTTIVGDKPVYTWNLAGYRVAQKAGGPNRYWFGGLTDQSFATIPLLEGGTDGSWPWARGDVA